MRNQSFKTKQNLSREKLNALYQRWVAYVYTIRLSTLLDSMPPSPPEDREVIIYARKYMLFGNSKK